jgi:hypothetical protein
MVYWENRAIIQNQEKQFQRILLPGCVIAKDELFKFATEVCAGCRQQVAVMDAHKCQGMTEGAGGGGQSGNSGGDAVDDESSAVELDSAARLPLPNPKKAKLGPLGTSSSSTKDHMQGARNGDSVLYTSNTPGEQPQRATIVQVHFDDPTAPYYTISIDCVESQTRPALA